MMEFPPQAPSSIGIYPQSLQIKLFQAFIFSIPILFSIILFLLFYLFYLKRSASAVSSHQPTLPVRSFNQALFTSSSEMDLKGNLVEYKFPTILFNEDTRTRDSTCCVCLGDFEMKEELHQIPTCEHVFHADCIRYWLRSNPTCPLCRCFIVMTSSSSSTRHQDQHLQLPVGVGPNLDYQMINPHMVNSLEQLEVRVITEGGHG